MNLMLSVLLLRLECSCLLDFRAKIDLDRPGSSCLKHEHCGFKDIYLKLHRFLLFQIGRAFIGRAETPPETCVGLNSQKRIGGMYKLKRRK